VARTRLDVSREQILAFRRQGGALDKRLPANADSLRTAAWAGLQDSMPRAALLSIHARVEGAEPSAWEDPSLAQVWGPRFGAYVVPAVPARDPGGPDLGGPDLGGPDLAASDLADALRAACSTALPRPKRPTEFCLVPELPLGATGKVSRRRLRELAMAAG